MQNAGEVAQAILDGSADNDLNEVVAAINTRRAYLTQVAKAQFKVGAHVRVTNPGRRYDGVTGVIRKKNQKTIDVTLDEDSSLLRVSASMLELA